MARAPSENTGSLTTPYYILRVDEIPQRISFYQLLCEIEPYSRHIIGIARTADYKAKRLGRTVYFYCTSLLDARFLERSFIEFVGDGRDGQACTVVDSVVGRAALLNESLAQRYHQVPVSVHVKGLERKPDAYGTTYYLKQIVPHFEKRGTITAFRLNYDVRRATTRNDAFVTFLYRREAREMGGEIDPINHLIFGRQVSAVLSDNVPMLVSVPDSHIFQKGICNWTDEVERLNQLIIQHTTRIVHPQEAPQEVRQDIQPKQVAPGPLLRSIIVKPPTSLPTVPASGSVKAKRASDKASKMSSKSKQKELDKLSTKAVRNMQGATTKKNFELVYDSSEEEILMVLKPKRRVMNLELPQPKEVQISGTATIIRQPTQQSNPDPDSEDEGRLIIDEAVSLPEDDDSSRHV